MTLSDADEQLHNPPPDSDALWSDNFWFSVCDREADVYGINHIHARPVPRLSAGQRLLRY